MFVDPLPLDGAKELLAAEAERRYATLTPEAVRGVCAALRQHRAMWGGLGDDHDRYNFSDDALRDVAVLFL